MIVVKRDGREVEFDKSKIVNAVELAMKRTAKGINHDISLSVANKVSKEIVEKKSISVEAIQDIVERRLMDSSRKDVAKEYILYRNARSKARKSKTYDVFNDIINTVSNEITRENANMNADTPAGMMMKFASESTKPYVDDCLLSEEVRQAILDNYIHPHDKDYFATKSLTCLQHPLDKILENGFRAGHGSSRAAKRIETAAILACICMETVQNEMHGGQAIPNFDFYLAPYVRLTYIEELKQLEEYDGQDYSSLYNSEIEDYLKKPIEELVGLERVKQQAINQTTHRVHQSMESFIHNMNTIHSRGGNQVVFSSINYGTDTSPEGRCIIREVLNSTYRGVGNGETPIFPIQIWKLKAGVSADKDDKNYDLLKLACKVTARRFFPNFLNLDAPFNRNDKWNIDDPKRWMYEVNTMGCVEGEEVITYRFMDKTYVESFKRFWNRLKSYFPVKPQNFLNENLYMDTTGVEILDTKKGFVNVKRVVRNVSNLWNKVKLSNGRVLTCTADHPFYTENRGRVLSEDLLENDVVQISSINSRINSQTINFNPEKAWLLGFLLCDGCYSSSVFASIAAKGEDDIQEKYISAMETHFELETKVVNQSRGAKGEYKDLVAIGNNDGTMNTTRTYLTSIFGGLNKKDRQIPQEVFSWNKEAQISFLAGMIDADGYVNPTAHGGSIVQIGSTNKELALQQMLLAQNLGYVSKVYQNQYSKQNPDLIRYRVEFFPDDTLILALACEKKKENYIKRTRPVNCPETAIVKETSRFEKKQFSYDVETESDFFEVSGIFSHNCRTRVFENRHGEKTSNGRGNLSFTTINLVRLGLAASSKENKMQYFYDELDKYIDIVVKQLYDRYKFQCTAQKTQFPLLMSGLWSGSEKLKSGDTVESVLKQGTLGVGFIGLAECLIALTGKHHGESKEAQRLGLEIITHLRDRVSYHADKYNLNFSVLATPAEGISGKFLKKDRKDFGIIEHITDKDYYTNSNHVPVWFKCSISEKAKIEAPYHALTLGGHIFYVEFDGDPTNNPQAVEQTVQIIRHYNIGYGSINHLQNRCLDCGCENAIADLEKCPLCGGENIDIIQRITGYLVGSVDKWNPAKKSELKDRVTHGGKQEKENKI